MKKGINLVSPLAVQKIVIVPLLAFRPSTKDGVVSAKNIKIAAKRVTCPRYSSI
jgi:hypothetical protein